MEQDKIMNEKDPEEKPSREGVDEKGRFIKGNKEGFKIGHGQVVDRNKKIEAIKRYWDQKNTRKFIFERLTGIKVKTQDGKELNFFEAGIDFLKFLVFAKDEEVKDKGYMPLVTADKVKLYTKLLEELTIKESTLNINSEMPVIIHVDADDRNVL